MSNSLKWMKVVVLKPFGYVEFEWRHCCTCKEMKLLQNTCEEQVAIVKGSEEGE